MLVPRAYSVFNAAQVDGWTPPTPTAATEIKQKAIADAFVASTNAQITSGHNHAATNQPETGSISPPPNSSPTRRL